MKVYHLLEELRPLLLDLIQQRLAKGENVYLEFWTPAKNAGSRMDFVDGKVTTTDGNTAYFNVSSSNAIKRYTFGPDADEKYRLDKVKDGWKVRSVKTKVAESLDGMLKTIIQQRLDKHDPVKLDFWHEGFTYQGYITLLRGNTIHSMHTKRNGDTETERFVLPPDADDRFTLRKLNGVWHLQGI